MDPFWTASILCLSSHELKNPKDSKRIQKNQEDSKKFKKIQKDSKRGQKIPKGSITLKMVLVFKLKKLVSPPPPLYKIKELEAPQQSWLGGLKMYALNSSNSLRL